MNFTLFTLGLPVLLIFIVIETLTFIFVTPFLGFNKTVLLVRRFKLQEMLENEKAKNLIRAIGFLIWFFFLRYLFTTDSGRSLLFNLLKPILSNA